MPTYSATGLSIELTRTGDLHDRPRTPNIRQHAVVREALVASFLPSELLMNSRAGTRRDPYEVQLARRQLAFIQKGSTHSATPRAG
jgi:hypothetical protein